MLVLVVPNYILLFTTAGWSAQAYCTNISLNIAMVTHLCIYQL